MHINRHLFALSGAMATEALLWIIVGANNHDIDQHFHALFYTHLPGFLLGFAGVLPKIYSQGEFNIILGAINVILLFCIWSVALLFFRRQPPAT